MKKQFIYTFQFFLITEIMVILLSFLVYKEISLISFINMSFYVGSVIIFLSLLLITIKGGFFDTITQSFRLFFLGRKVPKEEIKNMPPLSQIVKLNIFPYFLNGIIVIVLMLIALYYYYV